MVAILLESKYRAPARRGDAVARPRLYERLGHAAAPLTVVSAPAGFGKTTLVAEWLARGSSPLAWVSLDERDNDPALFWTYLTAAIQSAANGVGATARQLLSSDAPVDVALPALLNDLTELPAGITLVLDDYHLIESSDIHEAMAFLLEHLPPNLHVVLATRADPPLPLARMRAQGRLAEVRAADLRFTAAETATYLNEPMALGLDEAQLTTLTGRTEGWIAALQLAALSLRGLDDADTFIAEFAGDDRYVFDYLAEEVLTRQPAAVRDFLLRTSVLERLTGPLCDAVTGRADGRATLVELERANLFLVPLDARREWYRYHHLFADVLRAHLREDRPAELTGLHTRASAWFEAAGDPAEAARHALAAGDLDRTAELVELMMPMLQRERRETELHRWLRALPDDVVQARPVLGVAFVGALAQVSDFETVEARLGRIESMLRSADGTWCVQPPAGVVVADANAYRSVPAAVELYRAALALTQGDPEGTVAHARASTALAPADDDLVRSAAGALAGLALWAGGDLSGAHAAYSATVAGLTRVGWLADAIGCRITLGDLCRTQGRLGDALRTYEAGLAVNATTTAAEPLRGTADMHVAAAEVLIDRDDLVAAAGQLAAADRLGAHNGLPQNPYRRRVAAARMQLIEGDLDAALTLLDEAVHVYAGDYAPDVRPVPALRARLRIRRGELSEAASWAAGRGLSPGDDLSYLREYEHVTLARLLLARHQAEPEGTALEDAVALLERLLDAADAGGRHGTVTEILVLLALAHQARAELPEALDRLERAVVLAQSEGNVRVFADEGQPMATLLRTLARRTVAPAFVRRLLHATTSAPTPTDQALIEPLSNRELEVLRMLATDLDGPDIARRLSVSLNTMRTHTTHIYTKLGVTNRRAAVRRAEEIELLPQRHIG
ncbi:MAG TPA: LuxR C-terminal-related transcriptional regulator [Jatrophihabitans sp.]|jgi:LuxR family maltose regulon positive regulatory protein|uniref:LuxR C-terminal-related transcriptional regulator n=1 Tax=Jatrophihabitans sp. TaxID=1932789 RepID=UPI002E09C44C|nr:LuxR C-terminal-related transcriptional regulator [Jatrophihabitans sp.]